MGKYNSMVMDKRMLVTIGDEMNFVVGKQTETVISTITRTNFGGRTELIMLKDYKTVMGVDTVLSGVYTHVAAGTMTLSTYKSSGNWQDPDHRS